MRSVNDKNFVPAVKAWWKELQDDRGQRAALRRCAGKPGNAYLEPAYHRGFVRFMQGKGIHLTLTDCERLAPAVVVLACAKSLTDTTVPRLMATSGKGSEDVRDVRFRRLLSVQERGPLALELCRMVKLLGGSCDVMSVVKGILYWGDGIRRQWAQEYYSAQQ